MQVQTTSLPLGLGKGAAAGQLLVVKPLPAPTPPRHFLLKKARHPPGRQR